MSDKLNSMPSLLKLELGAWPMRTVFAAFALNVLLLVLRIFCRLHNKQRLGLDDCKHDFCLFLSRIQHDKAQGLSRLRLKLSPLAAHLDMLGRHC